MTTAAQIEEERRRLRRLQFMMGLVMDVIRQDAGMTLEEAGNLVSSARGAALRMFPGKELAYDLIYKPRFQRLIAEKYGLH